MKEIKILEIEQAGYYQYHIPANRTQFLDCTAQTNIKLDLLFDGGGLSEEDITKVYKLDGPHFSDNFFLYYWVIKAFLTTMGKRAGGFMKGSDIFYASLVSINQYARELLEKNHFNLFPPNVFVFWMHQGYQMAFFKLDEGDDPTVYYFREGEDLYDFKPVGSFTNFLKCEIRAHTFKI